MTTSLLEDPKSGTSSAALPICEEENKYLTFKLASEEYGVEILKVREIIGVMDITSVPRMPHHMKGVINLRGNVIPVIDLRLKFGLNEIEHTTQTCIIVVDVGREIGLVVDTVSEVLDIPKDDVAPPPAMGGSVDTSFIRGMGKVADAVKILLNIDMVLSSDELGEVVQAVEENESSPGSSSLASAADPDSCKES